MVSNLVEEFLIDYLKRRPYILANKKEGQRVTTMDEIVEILSEEEMIIRKNSDKTPEEIVDKLIADVVEYYNSVLSKYGVPGYTASVQVGNINVGMFGGKTSTNGIDMPEEALFDIASMTKFYTQIVIYNLIKDGLFKRSDKIKDLDSRFVNLGNVTVGDILRFSVEFTTLGRIDDATTTEEALNRLYNTEIAKDKETGKLLKGKHNYNDIGLMILKEVIEKKTGKTFEQLVSDYIITPLNLKNTFLTVPEDKYHLITATPNAKIGHINDMKANIMHDGYSGHAGIITNYQDIHKTMMAAKQGVILPKDKVVDTSMPSTLYNKRGSKIDYYGKMGNTYVPHYEGIDKSFVDSVDPIDTVAIAGSTRTNAAATKDSAYTVLFNPSSISEDEARERINKMNEEKVKNNKKPTDINTAIKHYSVNGKDGYNYIDPRVIMPISAMEDSVRKMALLTVKLRFLDFVLKKQEKYYEEVTVMEHIDKR